MLSQSGPPGRGRIVIVGGNDRSLWANRGDLIGELLARGWDVQAVLPPEERITYPPGYDIPIHRIPLARTGLNPLADIRSVRNLRQILDRLRPDVVLAYNPKPVIYSGLALRSQSGCRYVALITGRGPLERRPGLRGTIAFHAMAFLYGRALSRPDVILFQNDDDSAYFRRRWRIGQAVTDVVAGSGVNLDRFAESPLPHGSLRFLLISKLLVDKGVREFVAAARVLARLHPGCLFRVVGGHDPDLPHSLPAAEVEGWRKEGIAEFTGQVDDVRPHIAWSSVLCHPSYAEGTPRAVLEALSSGRAVITTDAPGCRQTVEDGRSGFLVPVGDHAALAERMALFAREPDRVLSMGAAARRRAEEVFDVRKVNQQMVRYLEGEPRAA